MMTRPFAFAGPAKSKTFKTTCCGRIARIPLQGRSYLRSFSFLVIVW